MDGDSGDEDDELVWLRWDVNDTDGISIGWQSSLKGVKV